MSKRIATSPAESEKAKKQDEKATPISPPQSQTGLMSFFRSKSAAAAAGTSGVGASAEAGQAGHDGGEGAEGDGEGWQTQGRRSPKTRSPNRTYSEATSNRSNARTEHDGQPRMAGPNPEFRHPHTNPVFSSRNEGSFRDFFDIEIRTINGQPFRGSITYKEAKHSIYREILEMEFSNFRGVRLGFKGVPTATILLKTQINLDDLESMQNFEFTRAYKKLNKATKQWEDVTDVLGCKIKGVRTVYGGEASVPYSEDWTRVVKIEGCDYMVDAETIMNFLGHYGEVKTDLVEDVFEDEEDSEGTNATGIYSVKVKLEKAIPQLVPIGGKRLKICYRNIQKLCTKCFGEHFARNCTNKRVLWIDYVKNFMEKNESFDRALFGNWNEIINRARKEETTGELATTGEPENPRQTSGQEVQDKVVEERHEERSEIQGNQDPEASSGAVETAPVPADYALPDTEDGINELIEKMTMLGMSYAEAEANVKKRKKLYLQALKRFELKGNASKKERPTKYRRNSLNAN